MLQQTRGHQMRDVCARSLSAWQELLRKQRCMPPGPGAARRYAETCRALEPAGTLRQLTCRTPDGRAQIQQAVKDMAVRHRLNASQQAAMLQGLQSTVTLIQACCVSCASSTQIYCSTPMAEAQACCRARQALARRAPCMLSWRCSLRCSQSMPSMSACSRAGCGGRQMTLSLQASAAVQCWPVRRQMQPLTTCWTASLSWQAADACASATTPRLTACRCSCRQQVGSA